MRRTPGKPGQFEKGDPRMRLADEIAKPAELRRAEAALEHRARLVVAAWFDGYRKNGEFHRLRRALEDLDCARKDLGMDK